MWCAPPAPETHHFLHRTPAAVRTPPATRPPSMHAPAPARPIPQLTIMLKVFYASRQHMSIMHHMEAGVARHVGQLGDHLRSTTALLERPHQLAPSFSRAECAPDSRAMGHAATVGLACLLACGEGCCGVRSDDWRRAAAPAGPFCQGCVGAGQGPKEAVRFGDLAPRGGRAEALDRVRGCKYM